MIRSMTAFAREQIEGEWGTSSCEIRSVNHRYLDINLKLPDPLRFLEMPIREAIKSKCGRGKIDCQLRFTAATNENCEVIVNEKLAAQLVQACNTINKLIDKPAELRAYEIVSWPGVLVNAEQDFSLLKEPIVTMIEQALDELCEVRTREGKQLRECILQRIHDIETQIASINTNIKSITQLFRDRFAQKVSDITIELDPTRLEQEIVILANKSDVTEEIDRLTTHCKEVKNVLDKGGAIGRRLDFLMQELNREANTLASKAVETQISNAAIEMKVLIEQMREQVQNLE